ncbi:hypothetical protein LTR35_017772 [Friedmanniomyces endolithicus]|uniref:Uncharacterized protein n=1 Tax=Friedmanniomyces endolithicus TaxID=329885 RepID=A0AAN6F3T3_9PEZI|nr:hypothetical protein LTR35_017772 [Friedmanniomyces endolithicus]KAK0268287.1 hypothetical protein LTS00_017607 [Friedmanniomyces endolithicus]KAK0303180.1 hypothetical protein LTR82_017634 [Friedmanniomyces endolithicus]KAK0971143.1 hypothetical protein LTR54_017840 [Friedmanniomyces endolithicus]
MRGVELGEASDKQGEEEKAEVTVANSKPATKRKTHARAISSGSKLTEELSRPTTAETTSTTMVKQTEVSISTIEVCHDGTTGLLDEEPATIGIEDEEGASRAQKGGLRCTASKGKEVTKSVGQAVRSSLKGAGSGSGSATGKLNQTMLSFGKMN